MKAALIDRYGSNGLVKVADITVPAIGPRELLVRVHAASVNPLQRNLLFDAALDIARASLS